MVIALAGRRVDAPGADTTRFPAAHVAAVRARIRELLLEQQAQAIVCSAACGADLLALEAAQGLGIRRRIVLPYTRARFRETSVVDRPGDWGERFDAMVDAAEVSGDLVVLGYAEGDETAYLATNTAIFEQAAVLAEQLHQTMGAAVVWDGAARGRGRRHRGIFAGSAAQGLLSLASSDALSQHGVEGARDVRVLVNHEHAESALAET